VVANTITYEADARTFQVQMTNKKVGESILCPPKIVVTKTKILHLVFLGACEHHILDFFIIISSNIALTLNLN